MVAVFSVFATLSFIDFKEMGVGLAVAILIDATIIRGVLLPATMKLLGDWNWYLPQWLDRMLPGSGRRGGTEHHDHPGLADEASSRAGSRLATATVRTRARRAPGRAALGIVRSMGRMPRRHMVVAVISLLVLGLAAAAAQATFPGQNGRISFSRYLQKSNSTQIFTANPDGSDLKQITAVPKNRSAVFSDWSPDGRMIAFDSNRTDVDGDKDVVQVYVANADGTGVVQLTRGPGFHADASWSPDGTKLAIEADWGDYPALEGIWIIPASGRRRRLGRRGDEADDDARRASTSTPSRSTRPTATRSSSRASRTRRRRRSSASTSTGRGSSS